MDTDYYCGACKRETGVDKRQHCFACGDYLGEFVGRVLQFSLVGIDEVSVKVLIDNKVYSGCLTEVQE